jgi:hypothetical protein
MVGGVHGSGRVRRRPEAATPAPEAAAPEVRATSTKTATGTARRRLAALAGRIRTKAIIEHDLLMLRLRHGRTLAPLGDGTGDVALVVSMSEFPYQLKLEAMVSKALELEGLTPVFVVPDGSDFARRYLRCFGIRRFVELRDYVDAGIEAEARREAELLISAAPTTAELRGLTFRGATIGRYVLSSVSRALHEGTVDYSRPEAVELVRRIVQVAVRSTLAGGALLDRLRPKAVLFIERNYASEAPISDLALQRGLNVIQFVNGLQDDTLVFKRYTEETRRVHPRSLSAKSWERVRGIEWSPERDARVSVELARRYDAGQHLMRRNQEWTEALAADEVRRLLGLERGRGTAVVFSHVLWDANMFYGEDLFADQEEWFVETVSAACANDQVDWIVKLHPANVWKRRRDGVDTEELDDVVVLRDRIGELPPHVKLLLPDSSIATRSLFDIVNWGITIRGSIGIELPSFGTPVLTAGTGFYSGLGFTVDSATREEYLARLARIQEVPALTPEEVELARRHAYALFALRPLRTTSFRSSIRPISELGHPLDHDLEVLVRSREELRRAPDLRAVGAWAVRSTDLDYLEDA